MMNEKEYENHLFEKLLPRLFKEDDVITNIQKESFDYFIHHRLQRIIDEEPMIDVHLDNITHIQVIFSQVYVDYPYIVDEKRQIKYITPNEARIRELTYSSAVSIDVTVREFINHELKSEKVLRKIGIARIPMMINTSKCNLYNKTARQRCILGECDNDTGGYFIIRGKERVLITQERGNLNHVYIFKNKASVKYSHTAEIRSTSEENGHSILVQMRLYASSHRITVVLPFFTQEISLSTFFLILGCDESYLDELFNSLILDGETHQVSVILRKIKREMSIIGSPEKALQDTSNYVVHSMIKENRPDYISNLLHTDMFPHLGITSSVLDKIRFLVFMLNKLLQTYIGKRAQDDRDHLNNKRFETAGYLVSELFRALYKRLVRTIEPQIQKKHDISTILSRTSLITQGLKTCFATGNWGIPKSNYIRCGVSQILSRLSFNSTISHLRRILIPIGKEGKNSKIRQIHSSQYGFICPSECFDPDTPILMWDGSIKLAKDIVVGDMLIDDDGKPTRVRKTIAGTTEMYEIKPTKNNFMNHTVTSNHILTLKVRKYKSVRIHRNTFVATWFDKKDLRFRSKEGFISKDEAQRYLTTIPDDNIIDITIDQYLPLSDHVKKHLVLFKCNGIQWEKQIIELDPYILGMWLGDGDSKGNAFYSEDIELINYWKKWANDNNQDIKLIRKKNTCDYNYTYQEHQINDPEKYRPDIHYSISGLKEKLSKYNLIKNKHIPKEFLVNDRETRLKVLAGLIDTDGSVRSNGHEIRIQQGPANTRIVEDALLLAQSLGFSCHLNKGISKWTDKKTKEKRQSTYTELYITGEFIHEIPTLLPRKKLNDHSQNEIAEKRCSSFLQSLFTIEQKGIGEFVGWQLEGNGRFLGKDATILHNTPEGQSAGVVKNFTLFSCVSTRTDSSHLHNLFELHFKDLLIENGNNFLLLNGRIISMLNNVEEFITRFYEFKKSKLFPFSISISYDKTLRTLYIFSDDGRVLRPLWNLREYDWDSICYHMKECKWSWRKLLDNNIIVFVDSYELENCLVAMRPQDITPNHQYAEIHPSFMFGICTHLIPYVDHIQAPRITYQGSMGKQAIGVYASSNSVRCDTVVHYLQYPEKPIVHTHYSEMLGYDKLPSGNNLIVAIACYGGYNQEDSVIFNQSSIDRGVFRCFTYRTIMTEEKKRNNNSHEIIELPDKSIQNSVYNYSKLNSRGIIDVGAYVGPNDVIIGKTVFTHKKGITQKSDNSVVVRNGEEGYIDRIFESITPDGYLMIKVKIRYLRIPEIGDKTACYHPDTDVLTSSGWKPITDISIRDKVACLIKGKELQYLYPTEVQSYDYNGKMYSVQSSKVDLCVTPNHRMYIGNSKRKNHGIQRADEIYGKIRSYKNNVDTWVPEKIMDKFILPAYGHLPDLEIDLEAWCVFMGIWYAEGSCTICYNDNGSIKTRKIDIAANKQRVRDALEICMEKIGLKWNLHMSRGELVKWYCSDLRLIYYLKPLSVGAINKKLPDWCFQLDQYHSRKFIDGMVLGDGNYMKDTTTVRYYTSSIHLRDDFQRLCLHAGYGCNYYLKTVAGTKSMCLGKEIQTTADYWTLTICKTQVNPIVNKYLSSKDIQHDQWLDYAGSVHCCTVPTDDGVILVRRNGKPVWCGQSRSAQKGTIGMILRQEDMPFTSEGIVPDIIINPHSQPSRMTINQLLECVAAKGAVINGKYVYSTPFSQYSHDIVDTLTNDLFSCGYERHGNETMYNGLTGEMFKTQIFIGPTYYQRLKHLVGCKIHARDHGSVQSLVRQPLEGRSKEGGLRFGEMERDCMISHGVSRFLNERLFDLSDSFKILICRSCGCIPNQANRCCYCDKEDTIYLVNMPYACKLLFQELMAIGLKIHFRLTDN
jgi:DNA-directed RNA polymerase beta subunit